MKSEIAGINQQRLAILNEIGFDIGVDEKDSSRFAWHRNLQFDSSFGSGFDSEQEAADDAWMVAVAQVLDECSLSSDAWRDMTFAQQRELLLVTNLLKQDGVTIEDKINELDPGANCDYQENGIWRVHGKQYDENDVRLYLLERHLFAEKQDGLDMSLSNAELPVYPAEGDLVKFYFGKLIETNGERSYTHPVVYTTAGDPDKILDGVASTFLSGDGEKDGDGYHFAGGSFHVKPSSVKEIDEKDYIALRHVADIPCVHMDAAPVDAQKPARMR